MTKTNEWNAGARFANMITGRLPIGGIWDDLEWEVLEIEPGRALMKWDATHRHCFPTAEGWIVHGGMITTLLDTACGQVTWSLLNDNEVFLTADLHTEFYRPTYPGTVFAKGYVVRKTRRITFAHADLYDANDTLLASTRVTNMTLQQ